MDDHTLMTDRRLEDATEFADRIVKEGAKLWIPGSMASDALLSVLTDVKFPHGSTGTVNGAIALVREMRKAQKHPVTVALLDLLEEAINDEIAERIES